MADKDETPEHFKQKLTNITNDLQAAIKTIDTYTEEQQVAERNRNELEDSKKKILVLRRQLAEIEAICEHHQNINDSLLRKNRQREAIIDKQNKKLQMNERFIKQRDIRITELEKVIEHITLNTTDESTLNDMQLKEKKTTERPLQQTNQTHNSLVVAELSDENRPTKLAERFTELFDNQWTDAFEQMEKDLDSEEDSINVLLQILQISGDIPAVVNKNIKEFRKNVAEFSGRQIYKKYQEELSRSVSSTARVARRIPNYVEECFKICWLMTVNDPPIVFGPNISVGETFNTDMYTAYTKSGNKVEFVVWPALLLHANGPVLCKGVAQGLSDVRGQKSAPPKSRTESVFNKITRESEKQLSPPLSHQQKQDSYSQTTVATKKSTYNVPSRHDIEMFMEWRELFGKERARELMGVEKYDNIRMYCMYNRLI